jgi:hypothetical protein
MQNEEKKGEFISDIVGKISKGNDKDYTEGMPTFDLGSQILAQQRKIAAMKRKSPGAPTSPENPAEVKHQPIKFVPVKIIPFQMPAEQPMSPQQKIIADIIAREIRILTAAR